MRALSCRNYRSFFLESSVSTIGTWVQIGAQSWLVLRHRLAGHLPRLAGVWMVLLVAFLPGVVLLVEDVTKEASVGELVEAENIVSAVGLNGTISSVARIGGPAAAGVIILTGREALCFLINAASYVAVVVSLLRTDTAELRQACPRAGKGAVRGPAS